MTARQIALATAAVVAVGVALALTVGPEPIEHVVRDETGGVRAPRGELLPPVAGGRAVVWAVGDADHGAEARALAAMIRRDGPDRLLYLGDVYELGNRASFRAWGRVWGPLAARTAPTPGNHDWTEAAQGYDPYWRRVRGSPVPAYYTLRAAGWEIVSVNSEAARAGQARWLREHVARRPGTCRVAFWHRPRHSAGPRGDAPAMEPFWGAVAGRARLVLSGHEHNLQRLRPRDGVAQFVVGAGGRGHAPLDRGDRRLAFADDRHTGALRLSLSPGRVRWSFVALGGRVLDTGTTTCARPFTGLSS
jgi:acid phosphatase type 7